MASWSGSTTQCGLRSRLGASGPAREYGGRSLRPPSLAFASWSRTWRGGRRSLHVVAYEDNQYKKTTGGRGQPYQDELAEKEVNRNASEFVREFKEDLGTAEGGEERPSTGTARVGRREPKEGGPYAAEVSEATLQARAAAERQAEQAKALGGSAGEVRPAVEDAARKAAELLDHISHIASSKE